jgi:hypothetical protein
MDIPADFTRIIILFDEAFKYDAGAKFLGYVVKLVNNARKKGGLDLY